MFLDLDTLRAARDCYVMGDYSLREIATQYALNWHTLRTRASAERWKDARIDYRLKLECLSHSATTPIRKRIGQTCYLCKHTVTHGSWGEDGLGVYHMSCRLHQDARLSNAPQDARRAPMHIGAPISQTLENLAERLTLELRSQVV